MQIFLGIPQLETKLKQIESDLQFWIDSGSFYNTVVSYQLNAVLQNISQEIATFGNLVVDVKPCKISLQKSKERQAQLMKANVEPESSIKFITLELQTQMNTKASNTSGCCILPCGKFVVSKYHPSCLLLCAPDCKIEKTISNIMPQVIDVVCVNNETVAVISYTKENINIVSLQSGKTVKQIYTTSPSLGLSYAEGNFIVCSWNGRIYEVRLEDSKINGIGGSFCLEKFFIIW